MTPVSTSRPCFPVKRHQHRRFCVRIFLGRGSLPLDSTAMRSAPAPRKRSCNSGPSSRAWTLFFSQHAAHSRPWSGHLAVADHVSASSPGTFAHVAATINSLTPHYKLREDQVARQSAETGLFRSWRMCNICGRLDVSTNEMVPPSVLHLSPL